MAVLFGTDPAFAAHETGPGHPERPARLQAVLDGAADAHLDGDLVPLAVRDATDAELELVHSSDHLEHLARFAAAGGGALDPDTVASAGSWAAARRAAGAGLSAIEALDRGEGEAAFLAVRPPGHHALPASPMGFCLLNNVAVAAAALAERGERVLVVDYDAHHGNGTQDVFYDDPRVTYVSFHEWPLYPGTGRLDEIGTGVAEGTTVNLPFPAGATGDVYLRALDEIVGPTVDAFQPTWVLVSAGFDAHRADPLTGLGLSAGDYGLLAARMAELAPAPGRLVAFLEGGYDLDALRDSVAATLPALIGGVSEPAEKPTAGGSGATVVDAAANLWRKRM
jgi:acetoin utilization deacetylase AcuC-like enzyme